MSGPLSGISVLDLTQMVAGPMATQILADQGAFVIKVEPLSGDSARAYAGRKSGISAVGATVNRNKHSIALNLKEDAGVAILKRMAQKADVLVENFRPGVVERLGISFHDLQGAGCSSLIYCSINGFGETGPMSMRRVYDPVIQAVSGLASVQADAEGRPHMMRLIIPDQVTAMTAAQAITAALLQRSRTGEGQLLRLSMLDAMVSFVWPEGMAAHCFVKDKHSNTKQTAFYTRDMVYETADKNYITAGAVTQREWEGLCKALRKPEWIKDKRFASAASRMKYANQRFDLTEEQIRTFSADAVLQRLNEHDVPCALINHPRQRLINDPQIQANLIVIDTEHPEKDVGRYRMCRPPARFNQHLSANPSAAFLANLKHAPSVGQDTAYVLEKICGMDRGEIDELERRGVVKTRNKQPRHSKL